MIQSFCFCLLPRFINPSYYLLLYRQTLSFPKGHVFFKFFIPVSGWYKQFSFCYQRCFLVVYLVGIHVEVIVIENITLGNIELPKNSEFVSESFNTCFKIQSISHWRQKHFNCKVNVLMILCIGRCITLWFMNKR